MMLLRRTSLTMANAPSGVCSHKCRLFFSRGFDGPRMLWGFSHHHLYQGFQPISPSSIP
jgi:hypothetical protein